jgi:hypothetical protein
MTQLNHATAITDVDAAKDLGQSQELFKEKYGIKVGDQIRLVKLAHMRYQHPDLDQIASFLQDFGMVVAKRTPEQIWFKGYGADPYLYYAEKGPRKFLGGAFEVESYGDLEKASKLPHATDIQKLTDAPGGGFMITVYDPSGFPVNLLYGQEPVERGPVPPALTLNYEVDKPRKRIFQRFEPGPAAVHKLGHYGICVKDFDTHIDFYLKNFNLIPTDFLYVETEPEARRNVALFAHIDRGEKYVDHHTFFMVKADSDHVHHCSFEVHDYDTQHLGHQWLAQKGYKSVWGVGRHILGSQIFDYWWDTTGNMIEHYADGDIVNNQTPVNLVPAGHESLAVWGPELPKEFLD